MADIEKGMEIKLTKEIDKVEIKEEKIEKERKAGREKTAKEEEIERIKENMLRTKPIRIKQGKTRIRQREQEMRLKPQLKAISLHKM